MHKQNRHSYQPVAEVPGRDLPCYRGPSASVFGNDFAPLARLLQKLDETVSTVEQRVGLSWLCAPLPWPLTCDFRINHLSSPLRGELHLCVVLCVGHVVCSIIVCILCSVCVHAMCKYVCVCAVCCVCMCTCAVSSMCVLCTVYYVCSV